MFDWLKSLFRGDPPRFAVEISTRGWSETREEALVIAIEDKFGGHAGVASDSISAVFTESQEGDAKAFAAWARKRKYRVRRSLVRD